MLLRYCTAVALTLDLAFAFRDTSSFSLFSTSQLSTSSQPGTNIASKAAVVDYVTDWMSGCPSDVYLLVSQPGVSASDLESSTPHLRRRLSGNDGQISTAHSVANVVGNLDNGKMAKKLSKKCGATVVNIDGSKGDIPSFSSLPQVATIQFSTASGQTAGQKADLLSRHDTYLNTVISSLSTDKYTVIYTTSPDTSAPFHQNDQDHGQYQMDEPYPSGMHTDLKRDLNVQQTSSNSSNLNSNLPLFERYRFVNSAIFMSLLVSLLLIIILYVGVSAIAGLEVSYMAFSKEMGPAAQKQKQQS